MIDVEFYHCMLGHELQGYHGALQDAEALYAILPFLQDAGKAWGHKHVGESLSFRLHNIVNNARAYASKWEGYSRFPYGKSFPMCKGHKYACTMCTSHTKRNPGRKFFCCNVDFISKNPLVGNQQCNSFIWVDQLNS